MKGFLIVLICMIAAALLYFIIWFLRTRAKGVCPICALKKFFIPRRLTLNPEEFEDYPVATEKPVMGWSSWNTFRQHIREDIILQTGQAMVQAGLRDVGYEYINIDDCWQSNLRDIDGRLQPDFSAFPSGMSTLIGKLNEKGLKVGLYTSNGTLTCEDLPASLGREDTDAASLAEWGCEFFKYDFCHHKVESGVAPLIECLEFSEKGKTPFAYIRPEDVSYTGLGRTVKEKRLPSGKAMGFLSYGSGKAKFTITAAHAGEYILTVCYRKRKVKRAPYLLVKTGGRFFEVVFPIANAFTPTGRVQATVELKEGENEIEIGNPIINHADAAFLQYRRMGMALKKASEGKKPIMYSICEWGMNRPYLWGRKAGNMWRTTPDIVAKWRSIVLIYSHTVKLWKYACKGHYNDPDMLEVGNGSLTEEENRAHFSLWCMMAAPLVLGNDLRKLVTAAGEPDRDNPVLKIVTNRDLMAIDADGLAAPAKRVKFGRADIIARPLENGDIALCFFNKWGGAKTMRFDITRLAKDPYFRLKGGCDFEARELWGEESASGAVLRAQVPRHGVKVYRIRCTSK